MLKNIKSYAKIMYIIAETLSASLDPLIGDFAYHPVGG